MDCDVLVIGAGAAGLVAAFRAAELGRRVVVLEKNRKPGVKILMSGGTRCNITHACDNRGIVEAYGPPGRFLHSALAALSVADTVALFEAEGVATKVEDTGKVFPVSNRAADVLAALVRRLERSGATLSLATPVTELHAHPDGGFTVHTPAATMTAKTAILTTGGRSYPGAGTTGDGYGFARTFGHTVIPPRPSLVPITSQLPAIAELRGLTLPDAALRILEGDRKLAARRGSLLFAHFGLTGPVALDLSRVVSGHAQPRTLTLELDAVPAIPDAELDGFLQRESLANGKKQLNTLLAHHVPNRLGELALAACGQAPDRKAAGLAKVDRQRLVRALKAFRVPISGTLGFEKAEVTAGGVDLAEVDSRTMMSRRQPGLYFAGELLDLDGPIGGYNFQAAWSTGYLAGGSAAQATA